MLSRSGTAHLNLMNQTDGVYELVLGNRRLLGTFFIIVILFGMFFTMGYVVGRNSAPAAAATSPAIAGASNAKPETALAAKAAPVQPAVAPPAPKVRGPAETKLVKSKPEETMPRSTPERAEASRARTAGGALGGEANAPTGAVPVTPGPGRMYLQVMALGKPQAGAVIDTLTQKGFHALLAQGPNASVFRVLVGPYNDSAALRKAKADLENAGFHPIVRKSPLQVGPTTAGSRTFTGCPVPACACHSSPYANARSCAQGMRATVGGVCALISRELGQGAVDVATALCAEDRTIKFLRAGLA